MEVSAPFSGLIMRGLNALTMNPKTPETPLQKLVLTPAPGCRQLAVTPVPSSLLASSFLVRNVGVAGNRQRHSFSFGSNILLAIIS